MINSRVYAHAVEKMIKALKEGGGGLSYKPFHLCKVKVIIVIIVEYVYYRSAGDGDKVLNLF
jgi:hypothetical protein